MTREEIKKLLAVIGASYPNFKPEDKTATVEAWHFLLGDKSYNDVQMAFKTFVLSGEGKGFAPSPDQLVAMTNRASELSVMGEAQAWAMVRAALGRSTYYSEEEYAKLPPLIQKAVGSAGQLKAWAMDDDFNESVISSNFMRNYRTVVERDKQTAYLPPEARERLEVLQTMALTDKRPVEDIKKEIEQAESEQFILNMKDGMTPNDLEHSRELTEKINRLKAELRGLDEEP